MNLILRTIPDQLKTTPNLKCVTLRFANYADMTETPLRSITNSRTWRSIMAPTYSTMTLWSKEPYAYDTDSLCRAIFYLSEIRSSVSLYTLFSLVTDKYSFLVPVIWDPMWPSHMLASQLDAISPRGPRVYLSVIWMDKFHSWSMSFNSHFLNTQRHLYHHPVTKWLLMSSKYSPGVSD